MTSTNQTDEKCTRCKGAGGGKYLSDSSGLWQHCPYCDGSGLAEDQDDDQPNINEDDPREDR